MDVYKSRNSDYYLDGKTLVRKNNEIELDEQDYKGDVFYVPRGELKPAFRKNNLELSAESVTPTLATKLKEEFKEYRVNEENCANQIKKYGTKGHFFVLTEGLTPEDNHSFFYSGNITDIEGRLELGELNLAD